MRNYIQRFKQFLTQIVVGGRTVVTLRGGQDFAVDDGARIGFEGAAGDTFIHKDGANIEVHINNTEIMRGSTSTFFTRAILPLTGAPNIGSSASRFGNIRAATEIGIDTGAGFTDSLVPNGLNLGALPALQGSPTNIKVGGDGAAPAGRFMNIPSMTTVEAAAIGGVDGDFYYDVTLNQLMGHENGAFRNM